MQPTHKIFIISSILLFLIASSICLILIFSQELQYEKFGPAASGPWDNDDRCSYSVKASALNFQNVIKIPAEYKGMPIVKIESKAFAKTKAKCIFIPTSITHIDSQAF